MAISRLLGERLLEYLYEYNPIVDSRHWCSTARVQHSLTPKLETNLNCAPSRLVRLVDLFCNSDHLKSTNRNPTSQKSFHSRHLCRRWAWRSVLFLELIAAAAIFYHRVKGNREARLNQAAVPLFQREDVQYPEKHGCHLLGKTLAFQQPTELVSVGSTAHELNEAGELERELSSFPYKC